MAISTVNSPGILAPEEIGPLIIQPLRLRSVALRTSTVIETTRPSLRFPIVELDAAATWLAEGDDITETDPDIGECVVTPVKVGALVKVSNEMVADSAENAQAAGVIGNELIGHPARRAMPASEMFKLGVLAAFDTAYRANLPPAARRAGP